jgi:amino acid adenylation domain-containing protein
VRWTQKVDPRRIDADIEALAVAHGDPAEPLSLPEQRARAAVHVYREESVQVELPASLEDIAARLGGTVEVTVLAGLSAVLSWYTGQPDLVIGTTRDLRATGDSTVVGPMTNLIPLRLRPEANRTVAAMVEECGTQLELASRHRFGTFEDLVLRLDPAKDMSRLALFDVLYQYVAPAMEMPGGAQPLELDSGYGKYDLHAVVHETPTGHAGRLVYNAEYFDREFIAGLAEHLGRWLELAGADPAAVLGRIDASTEEQRTTQLVTWNDTAAEFPDITLDALVLDQARRTPDQVAVSDTATALTYAELAERAEAVAKGLAANGVQQGDLVALRLPRGVGQVVAMLAVLRAGAGYLPIDPGWPTGRVEFLRSDSGARLTVGTGGISLTELASAAAGGVLPDMAGNPAGTAYCIYTSGTTGQPKGVLVTHRNAVRLLTNDRFPFRFRPRDVWTMLHSYSFDFSVWEVFGCLSTGGSLLVPDQDQVRDPHLVWRLLVTKRVTVLNQTPGAFLRLAEAGESEPDFPAGLRYVIFGGERLDPRTLAGALTWFPDAAFVNMYGITEGTVHATVHRVTQSDVDGERGSVIGRPIPTTTVHLLDRHSRARLVPVGSAGEICLGGLGVADGYLRRPELTDRLFRANPFGPGRLFHTGDLARYRPDGTLEFIGRADARVKVRGYRVELGEIEARLREHERVADAVVLLDEQVADSLAAFVRPSGGPPDPAHLRAYLAERLPSYQVLRPRRPLAAWRHDARPHR